jgi:hypothetical protein
MKPSGKPLISMRKALADPRIFGGILKGKPWDPWRSVLIAARGGQIHKARNISFYRGMGDVIILRRWAGALVSQGAHKGARTGVNRCRWSGRRNASVSND